MQNTTAANTKMRFVLAAVVAVAIGLFGAKAYLSYADTTSYSADDSEEVLTDIPESRLTIPDDDALSLPAYTAGMDPGAPEAHDGM